MYAPNFDYFRAASLAEAHRLLDEHPGARLLAGGHSLLPLVKLRMATPSALVDLGRVDELRGISRAGGSLRIGAMTTHAEIARSQDVRAACGVLGDAAGRIGDPAVRNRGTIGGSLAHADPGADLPTVLAALGAEIEIAEPSGVTRTMPIDEFLVGMMATALGPAEILTAVIVPALGSGQGAAYEKFAHPASRYAVVGAAAAVTVQGGLCKAARLTAGGLVPRPTRLEAVEGALVGRPANAATAAAAAAKADDDLGEDVIGDLFASAAYRRQVVPTFVARAIARAIERAG
jgi:aerobic carbon-monoxide dehydrogenase medium subunit